MGPFDVGIAFFHESPTGVVVDVKRILIGGLRFLEGTVHLVDQSGG